MKLIAEDFKKVLNQLNTNDLLDFIGMQRKSNSSLLSPSLASHIGAFTAGIVVGTVVALLVAPKAGRDIRSELGEKATTFKDMLIKTVSSMNAGQDVQDEIETTHIHTLQKNIKNIKTA